MRDFKAHKKRVSVSEIFQLNFLVTICDYYLIAGWIHTTLFFAFVDLLIHFSFLRMGAKMPTNHKDCYRLERAHFFLLFLYSTGIRVFHLSTVCYSKWRRRKLVYWLRLLSRSHTTRKESLSTSQPLYSSAGEQSDSFFCFVCMQKYLHVRLFA